MGTNEKENKSKNEGHYFEIASQQKIILQKMLYRHQNQKKQIKRNRGVYTISWILELINNIPYILSYMIRIYILIIILLDIIYTNK